MKKKIFLLKLFLVTTFFIVNAQDFDFQQIGSDIDGEATNDKSGWSIALSSDGSTVVIGAIRNDGNGDQSGQVRIYEKIDGVWIQIGDDIDGDAASNFMGDSVAINADGSVIAIGASGNSVVGFNAGQVKVYENLNGTWSQIGNDILGAAYGDQFGKAISLSANGNLLVVGANYNDDNGADSGHVRVYERLNNVWTQIGADIQGEATLDGSGRRLSMSADGSVIAVGAPFNDGNGRNTGHVRVFERLNNNWSQIGDDIDGSAIDDNSGWSVSLSADGNTLAIGAPFNDGNGDRSGHVRVYRNVNSTWTQFGADIYGEAAGDLFGYSVSLNSDGTVLAVSGIKNNGSSAGPNAGYAQVYKNEASVWLQIGTDIYGEAGGDQFGYKVSLSDDGVFLAVSAVNNDGNGINAGHVRVFEFKPTLGVEDISSSVDYIIFYPNPSKEEIFFNEKVRLENISLYTLEGKLISTQNMEHKSILDVSNLSKGVYILKIKTVQNSIITRRLIRM